MLAHLGPVRATARKPNLFRRWEQAGILLADTFHDPLGQTSLQKLNQRINRPRAVFANGPPARLRDRGNLHHYLINLRTADQRFDLTGRNLEINDRTIAHVSPSARQAVGKVAVAFEVLTPRLAPEGLDDRSPFDR